MEENKVTIWSVPFVVLMLTNLFSLMASFMVNTTLPVYLSDLNVDVSLVGAIAGCFAASAILVRPIAGSAFVSFPRKKLLMFSQAIGIVCLLGYALFDDPLIIMAFRLMHGIGIGCSGPLTVSMAGDFIPQAKFATGISTFSVSLSAAQVVGPATGLFLIDLVGYRWLYIICALSVAAASLCLAAVAEKPRPLKPFKIKLSSTFAIEAVPHTAVVALYTITNAAIMSYLPLMGREYGIANVGFYFALYALTVIVAAPQYGRLSDRYGNERVLLVGFAFFALAYNLLQIGHSVPMLTVIAVLSALGYGSSQPQIQSLAMKATDISRSAVVNNTYYTGIDIGYLVGPALAGGIISALAPYCETMGQTYSSMWPLMFIPATLGFLIVVYWNIKKSKEKKYAR